MDNLTTPPTHIGIIMDGNRRWANKEGLPTLKGHQEGLKTMVSIAEHIFSRGAKYLSVYAFSTENWNRSESEVEYLMDLVPFAFKKYLEKLDEQNIRLLFMGSSTGVKKVLLNYANQQKNRLPIIAAELYAFVLTTEVGKRLLRPTTNTLKKYKKKTM
nr:undecaprenyl diphosphate synthase family protein [Candidatus Saccharibacteria bacterium]